MRRRSGYKPHSVRSPPFLCPKKAWHPNYGIRAPNIFLSSFLEMLIELLHIYIGSYAFSRAASSNEFCISHF